MIRCREQDIRMLCPTERKDKHNFTLYTLWIYIEGIEKPLACNYDSPEDRDRDCQRISEAWENSCRSDDEIMQRLREIEQAHQSMQDAIRKTADMLEEVRAAEGARKRAGNTRKTKKKESKPFIPPTFEEVTEYIISKGYEQAAHQKPEGIARRFIRYYTTDDGKWRFKDGRPVHDWKRCMANWINRIDEDEEAQESGSVKQNQFTQGVESNSYDFDQLEAELMAPDAHEEKECKE